MVRSASLAVVPVVVIAAVPAVLGALLDGPTATPRVALRCVAIQPVEGDVLGDHAGRGFAA